MFRRKPHVHTVLKEWTEHGFHCWLLSFRDFNNLYRDENVIQLQGRVCATLTFAGNQVVVYRDEK